MLLLMLIGGGIGGGAVATVRACLTLSVIEVATVTLSEEEC